MSTIIKDLTCFYSDGVEYQTCLPIAEEAVRRGYQVSFSNDLRKRAEIGLYCQHRAYPKNSKFPIVMLHDMAQQHGNWPNIWIREPWDVYSIGILPGPAWEERWQQSCWHPFAHPKLGVVRGGWPKSDKIFKEKYKISKEELKRQLGLTREKVILYAPSWECNNKQDEFVSALIGLDVDLILKQAPWSDEYANIKENIRLMNEKHKNIADNVHIVEPDTNIFDWIKVADIMVSDESSVMFEGLLLDVPSIAVTDWMIPDMVPARFPCIPYDFVIKTEKSKLLGCVQKMLDQLEEHKAALTNYKNMNFYEMTDCSSRIMDVIDRAILSQNVPEDYIQPGQSIGRAPLQHIFRRYYWELRIGTGYLLRKWKLRK